MAKDEADGISSVLRTQLNALGVRLVQPEQAAAVVQVSLSENVQNYVWVAQIRQSDAEQAVAIVTTPRIAAAPIIHEPAVLLVRKIQLWSQEDRILDVGVIDSSPPQVIVLDPNKIVMYGLQGGHWEPEQSFAMAHSQPWPRDVRGRLVLRKDHLFDAYLPGTFCTSSSNLPVSVSCHDSDDPWPLGTEQVSLSAFFTPRRNFFTGVLSPGIGKETTVPAFYSGTAMPRDKYVLWLFAGVDGQVHEADGVNTRAISQPGWGSDIASLKTGCGSGWQALVTSSGDGTEADSVRAYEVPDREPVAVSQPVDLGGRVTALWTEQSGSTAVLVSRNLETGKYEAFRLAIACGQ